SPRGGRRRRRQGRRRPGPEGPLRPRRGRGVGGERPVDAGGRGRGRRVRTPAAAAAPAAGRLLGHEWERAVGAVETAVICAAGTGSRLGVGVPKCLISVDGRSIIDRQLDLLVDVPDVRVAVGYREDLVV